MNILKIQQDIIANIVKGKKLYQFTINDANIGVVHDGIIAYIIPRDKFLIGVEHIASDVNKKLNAILNPVRYKDYEPAKLTIQLLMPFTPLHPDELIQKIAGATKHIWARRSLIKQFSALSMFAINGLKDPIQVFENGVYAGLILPCTTKFSNDEQEDNL